MRCGDAADGGEHRAVGRQIPTHHGDAALGASARSIGRMTSSTRCSPPAVLPHRLAVHGQRVASSQQAGLAKLARTTAGSTPA
jgi:hypothetical protein